MAQAQHLFCISSPGLTSPASHPRDVASALFGTLTLLRGISVSSEAIDFQKVQAATVFYTLKSLSFFLYAQPAAARSLMPVFWERSTLLL